MQGMRVFTVRSCSVLKEHLIPIPFTSYLIVAQSVVLCGLLGAGLRVSLGRALGYLVNRIGITNIDTIKLQYFIFIYELINIAQIHIDPPFKLQLDL